MNEMSASRFRFYRVNDSAKEDVKGSAGRSGSASADGGRTQSLAPDVFEHASEKPGHQFSVTSYNVLARAYVKPSYYPRTPSAVLDPERRRQAVVSHVKSMDTDIICLQEVERPLFEALRAEVEPLGYQGTYAQKRAGKPDGCLTFHRGFSPNAVETLHYSDGVGGNADSGHVALLTSLDCSGQSVGIANTHLKWDPRGKPASEQYGYRELSELLDHIEKLEQPESWIVCGDFNATSDSDILHLAAEHRLADPFDDRARTCVTNGKAKRIDYLLHTAALSADACPPPQVEDDTPLPSNDQPSDHIAITARFRLNERSSAATSRPPSSADSCQR